MVLITGAGGTIGSALARRLSGENLILIDNCEYNLYRIGRELPDAICILGDIRNQCMIDKIFDKYRPRIVYHAAAVKHVAIAEQNIAEAARVNVFGTKNIADACHKYSCPLVMISTDKAVNPVSIMGITKAIAEAYCLSIPLPCAVARFVNVAHSSGSVLPLFKEQIEQGLPLTVTHPDVTRYFVTIDEAVDFVIGLSGKIGVFALCGKLYRIDDIARQMIKESQKDLTIDYIGLKAGERLHEIIDDTPCSVSLGRFDELSDVSMKYDDAATKACMENMLCR